MGVEILVNTPIESMDQLFANGFDAVLLAVVALDVGIDLLQRFPDGFPGRGSGKRVRASSPGKRSSMSLGAACTALCAHSSA